MRLPSAAIGSLDREGPQRAAFSVDEGSPLRAISRRAGQLRI